LELLLLLQFGVALLEALHPAGCIHHAPLAGIEGVAGAAQFYLELFLVEPVVNLLPQEQVTSASVKYLGWIFSFIFPS
jgi:hypothetical protein